MRPFLAATVMMAVLAATPDAQIPGRGEPTLPKVSEGAELYRIYCASCHGQDGKGRPASPAMRTPSTDLTALARNNRGVFPRERVRRVIANGTSRSGVHARGDMPVWGTIFRAVDPSDTAVDMRLDSLVRYVESLQQTTVVSR
jgi:mono/diheme cytochrome c family protein